MTLKGEIGGGTLIWGTDENFQYNCLSTSAPVNGGQGAAFPEFLPKRGAELIIPSTSTNAHGAIYFTNDGDYSFDGDIYATNAVPTGGITPGFIRLYGNNRTVTLTGGGNIYASGFSLPGSYAKLNLGVSALYLGRVGLNPAGSSCETYILDDLVRPPERRDRKHDRPGVPGLRDFA